MRPHHGQRHLPPGRVGAHHRLPRQLAERPTHGARAAGRVAVPDPPLLPPQPGRRDLGPGVLSRLFRLYDDPGFETASPRSNALLAGLLAAAICTLRQNYISAAVGYIAIVHLALIWFPGPKLRQDWLRQGGQAALAVFVFLLPWDPGLTIAIHSPFYPVVRGNVRPDFGMIGRVTFDEEVRWALQNLFMFTPVSSIALFFVAVFILRPSRQNRAIQAFMLTNMVAFALMMHFFRAFHDADSIARYYFAFSVAFCLAATLRVLEDSPTWALPKPTVVAVGLVAIAVGYQFVINKETIRNTAQADVTAFNDLVARAGRSRRTRSTSSTSASRPPSRPANRCWSCSTTRICLTAAATTSSTTTIRDLGPKGGPPTFKGPEALASYLHGLGIRYLAYQIGPSSREYDVSYWERMAANAVVTHGRGNFYEIQVSLRAGHLRDLPGAGRHPTRPLLRGGDARAQSRQADVTGEPRRASRPNGAVRAGSCGWSGARTRDTSPCRSSRRARVRCRCSWPCEPRRRAAARRRGPRPS